MIDIKRVENNPEESAELLSRKGVERELIDTLLEKVNARRKAQQNTDNTRAEANKIAKNISKLFKEGKKDEADLAKQKGAELKTKVAEFDAEFSKISEEINDLLLNIPNFPDADAPVGKSEEDNVTLRIEGYNADDYKWREFIPHWEIADKLGLFDIERAAKTTGSMSVIFKGNGAKLLRALINFALDLHRETYTEIIPPHFVNSATFTATGHLPKFADDAYAVKDMDYYLIPTGEVPITGMHRDEMLDENQLPLRYMAYTVCFRREAGAAGKDTRGLQRLHEFHKLELLRMCTAENLESEFQALLADAEKTLKTLELPYRVVDLCTTDMTFTSSRVYDLEIYAPGLDKWLEASSCGKFTDYQARRGNIRYKDSNTKKPKFVNFINGSGLAVPRVYAAILEHGWNPEGFVMLPKALQKYFGNERIL